MAPACSCADAPESIAAVLNPLNIAVISSIVDPSGASLACKFVTPSKASIELNPNFVCASVARFKDWLYVPFSFVSIFNLWFNFSKLVAAVMVFFANNPIPTLANAVFNLLTPALSFVV